jgi:hypothetical protein
MYVLVAFLLVLHQRKLKFFKKNYTYSVTYYYTYKKVTELLITDTLSVIYIDIF